MLKTQGIDYRATVDQTGPICLRRITIEDDTWTFEIDDELGEPGFVLAVHAIDAESVIVLVGWPVRQPEAWCTCFGFAGLPGGDAAVNSASLRRGAMPHLDDAAFFAAKRFARMRCSRTNLGLLQLSFRKHMDSSNARVLSTQSGWSKAVRSAINLKIPSVRAAA